MKLPASLDSLTGLRAARWVRESTRGQFDNFGPDAQRDQQDRAIERWGLVDTGISWTVAHSGRTVGDTAQFREMLLRAGTDFDVLVVGYVSRFARDLRTAVNARHGLHAAGAAILFVDERVLTSDEDAWDHWARETVESESFSRRLGRNIRSGYEAKFRRLADQAGNAPLGFRRSSEPPHVLEVDPSTIGRVVEAFGRYAVGTVSIRDLAAEMGFDPDALRAMLANPVYNGWVSRHGERRPATWRDDPPVPDALWAQVQEVRARRHNGGGHPTPRHAHLLKGLLWCPCGRRIRSEWNAGSRRYRHECPRWERSTVPSRVFDEPIGEQVRQTRLTAQHLAALRSLGPKPDTMRRRLLERERESAALRHARGTITTAQYLAEHQRVTDQLSALRTETPALDPDAAVRWLSNLRRAWDAADVAARHGVIAALYNRITVTRDAFVEVELSSAAYHHGLALAMPEVVEARLAGDEPARTIPIVGRADWLALLERTA